MDGMRSHMVCLGWESSLECSSYKLRLCDVWKVSEEGRRLLFGLSDGLRICSYPRDSPHLTVTKGNHNPIMSSSEYLPSAPASPYPPPALSLRQLAKVPRRPRSYQNQGARARPQERYYALDLRTEKES